MKVERAEIRALELGHVEDVAATRLVRELRETGLQDQLGRALALGPWRAGDPPAAVCLQRSQSLVAVRVLEVRPAGGLVQDLAGDFPGPTGICQRGAIPSMRVRVPALEWDTGPGVLPVERLGHVLALDRLALQAHGRDVVAEVPSGAATAEGHAHCAAVGRRLAARRSGCRRECEDGNSDEREPEHHWQRPRRERYKSRPRLQADV